MVGAPFSWEHAGGDIVDWPDQCRTTDEMRERVERHPATFGRVVDAFTFDDRLYATIKLNDGVRVPPPIADWMETSLSDICWPTSEGHAKPEIIELSGTGSAGRPGCRVLSQIDPRIFRSKMAQESVLARMTEPQKTAMQKLMKLLDSHPDAIEFAKTVPQELRDAIGPEFAAIVTNLEKARTAEQKSPAGPAGAPAGTEPSNPRTQQLEEFARSMAIQKLESYGVPKEMSTDYFAGSDPAQIPTMIPQISAMLEACSKSTMERLGHRQPSEAEPEPQRKMQCQEGDWRSLSDHNLSKIKQFRGY